MPYAGPQQWLNSAGLQKITMLCSNITLYTIQIQFASFVNCLYISPTSLGSTKQQKVYLKPAMREGHCSKISCQKLMLPENK